MTPHDLRAQLIRLHMLGADRVILHALYADAGTPAPSALDNMRFDFPPGYNLQPWWPVMGEISDEIADLATFLTEAAPVRQVAVLYPYMTALAEGPRHMHAARFGEWCEALVGLGHRPLIVDEAGLASARITREGVTIHDSDIAALVLPGVTALHDPQSAVQLTRIAAAGVPIWDAAPDGGLAARIAQAMAGTPVPDPVPGLRWHVAGRDGDGWWRVVAFNEGRESVAARLQLAGGVMCREIDGSRSEPVAAIGLRLAPQELRCLMLREAVATAQPPPLPLTAESLLMELGDGWTLELEGTTRPISVRCGWERQGFAAVSGTGRYERSFTLTEPGDLVLHLPGLACAALVTLDGHMVGRIWRAPWRHALGPVAAGVHHLRIDVANTAANAFYAGTPFAGDLWPDASGLTQSPRLLRR